MKVQTDVANQGLILHLKHLDTFSSAALASVFLPPEFFQVFKLEIITLLHYDTKGRPTNSH